MEAQLSNSPAPASVAVPGQSVGLVRRFTWVAGVFILSRLLLVFVGYMAHTQMLARMAKDAFPWDYDKSPAVEMWGPWDSGWYLGIAQWGYSNEPPRDQSGKLVYRNYAFFPGYPMLVRWLFSPFCGSDLFVPGLLLNNLFACGALWLVFLICRHLVPDDESIACNAVILASFFPNSFVYSSFYTESLFLFLLAGVLLLALHKRWFFAGLLGAALSATRVNGITIVLPVAFLILQSYPELLKGKVRRESLCAVASLCLYPVGLLAFMAYLKAHIGDPFGFLTVSAAWDRKMGFYFDDMALGPFRGPILNRYLATYTLVCFGLIQYLLYKRQYLLYITSMMLILPALVNGLPFSPFVSVPRYLLVVFPVYIALAMALRGKPTAFAISLASLALVNGFLMVYWVTGMNVVT